jgi:microcystin-dependent protein
MSCSNCYTGCTQIFSDKCIKYTGLTNEILDIKTDDSLSWVQSVLMTFVTANANGTGVKYELAAEDLCTITSQYLLDGADTTVIDITRALSKSICELDTTTQTLISNIATIEQSYTPGCIAVAGTEGTHVVLQATMDQVCVNSTAITATNLDLSTNYVAIADIDTYMSDSIAAYVAGEATPVTGHAAKMVPYSVIEYYGSLTYFDATGAGTGDWVNIYLCNGNNNTPDKRGRSAIGTTSGMGGGSFSSVVDPSIEGNPVYALSSTGGSNTVTLVESQMPAHSHVATNATSGAHIHTFPATLYTKDGASGDDNTFTNEDNTGKVDVTQTNTEGDHTHIITVSNSGSGGSHPNVHPVIACHYIMYIPV